MRNLYLAILTIALFLITMVSCNQKEKADLLVYNAKVYTVDDNFTVVSALAVKDGKIVAVGNDDEIKSLYQAKNMLDAGGKPVYPGFNDGHSHFLSYGLTTITNADLVGTQSFDEVVSRVIEIGRASCRERV